MFFDEYFNANTKIKQLAKNSGTFADGYDYWKDVLLEKTVKLFKWGNTFEVPSYEIELALMLNGSAGITDKYKKKLSVFNGRYCGEPTQYYDVYKSYSVYSPVYSAILDTEKDVVVVKNNSLRNSIYPLVHRYAIMLAHTEVSFVNTLINGRDKNPAMVSTSQQKAAVEEYRNNLCNGKVTPILDPAFSGVEFASVASTSDLSIKDLMETRQNLIDSFLNEIGVKTSFNKKGNMIADEVSANDTMLILNLSDMLESRKIGCEEINKRFGTNWTVDLSPELKYNEDEKEVTQNDTDSTEENR